MANTVNIPSDLNGAIEQGIAAPSSKSDKWLKVQEVLAGALGAEPDAVIVKAVASVGDVKNRIGEMFSKSDGDVALGVLVVQGDAQLAEQTFIASRKIVEPTAWVDTLAIAEKRGGGWEITRLRALPGSKVATQLQALFPALAPPTGPAPLKALTVNATALADQLCVTAAWIDDFVWMLRDRRAVVLYGPPGTGKTFIAQAIARALQPSDALRALVQLHPSYGYEDFFEGFRPDAGKNGMTLVKRSGPLRRLAEAARRNPGQPVVLVLDEMNRGNLPRVFGELYFLLEYRAHNVTLMYSPDEQFELPPNLFFIGSMNTADRSIAVLDQAVRRRFHFAGLFPGEPPVDGMLRAFLARHRPGMSWVADLLDEANRRLGDRNMAIGPSHFMRRDLDDEILGRVWRCSVLPSIEEQFFGNAGRVKEFELDALRAVVQGPKKDGGGT